ncbi:hypothetical protein N4G65_30270, partial [Streptomyces fulvoviolaceus]|nr:hypothetical protein [Streptomyces fulvoviolaceus]
GAVPPQSQAPSQAQNPGNPGNSAPETGRRRRPQLPGRGGARAELPGGGNPQPRTPSWSDENAQPPVPRASLDTPRGHDEPDQTSRMPRIDDRQGFGATAEMPAVPRTDNSRQGPGATSEFPRPDFDAPAPGSPQNTGQFARPGQDTGQFPPPASNPSQNTGGFVRSDVFGTPPGQNNTPQNTGQFAAPQAYDSSSTGQFATPGFDGSSTGQHSLPGRQNPAGNPSSTGQFERPPVNGGGHGPADFGVPRPPVPPRPQQRPPARQDPEALPPAGPGDGRTPLYDTLETNWFHGQQGQPGNGSAPAPASPSQPQQAPAAPQRPAANAGWRSSPNDDLVRQAERVRQPAAGGVTTSGLPRRVPRANLVPGTAQQQQHQSGPAVSRAPDDVRGRLTNLRRGIAQGRQASDGQTGSHPSPTHQQER